MVALAIAAACLHVLGYAVYIGFIRRGYVEANPLSWLMFAYGTGLLTFLEFRAGAALPELLLPLACSVSSVIVAAQSLHDFRFKDLAKSDLWAFAADLLLTVAYVALWTLERRGVSTSLETLAVTGLLVAANLTTVVAFLPILRSTFRDPRQERAVPWLIWTLAYSLLLTAMLPVSWKHLPLLIYPALNTALHLLMAIVAASRWWRSSTRQLFEIRDTGRTGRGLFATQTYNRGERVFRVTGLVRRGRSRSVEDAMENENWIGVGDERWIDPDHPYVFLNHSCEPNLGIDGSRNFVALRAIAAGEELTFDYAISEVDPHWTLRCCCGSAVCRRVIGPIQTLPVKSYADYLPYIGKGFQRRYLRQST